MMDRKNSSDSMAPEETTTLSNQLCPKVDQTRKKWRPSELEIAVLKMHFRNNQFPTLEEKETILKSFEVNFSSQVTIGQLNRWFKNEREKTCRKNEKYITKHAYRKLEQGEVDYLTQTFIEDNYPTMDRMNSIAKHMNCSLSKIENWFKHNRRKLTKQGCLPVKPKKYFKKDELDQLMNLFEKNPCPPKKQLIQLAESLNCDKFQVKNWYSNRRRKFRLLDKKTETANVRDFAEADDTDEALDSDPICKLDPDFDTTSPQSTPEWSCIKKEEESCNSSASVPQTQIPSSLPSIQQTSPTQNPVNPAFSIIHSNTNPATTISPSANGFGYNREPNNPHTAHFVQPQYLYTGPLAVPNSYLTPTNAVLTSSAVHHISNTKSLTMTHSAPYGQIVNHLTERRDQIVLHQHQIPLQPMMSAQMTYHAITNHADSFENYAMPNKRLMLHPCPSVNNGQNNMGYLVIFNPNR